MSKLLTACVLTFAGMIISCGVAVQSTTPGDTTPGDTTSPDNTYQVGDVEIVSLTVDKPNADIYVGDTITVSGKWEANVPLAQTEVKLYVGAVSSYPDYKFTCDRPDDPCKGGFTINCVYKVSDIYPGVRHLECTLPDGTVDTDSPGLPATDLPKTYCFRLKIEAKDVNGVTYYRRYEKDTACFRPHP